MPQLPVPTSTGTITSRAIQASGCSVTLARFPSLLRLASHTHERACLTVLLDGVMAERLGGIERYCERASVLIKPGLDRHDDLFGRDGSVQIIIEPSDLEQDLFAPYRSLFSRVRLVRDGMVERLARRLANELQHPDDFSSLATSSLTGELVVAVARTQFRARTANAAPPAWLRRTHESLRENVRVPTLAVLAQEAGVHPAHLARAFRMHYGCSVGQFVRHIRIESAARDLLETDGSLAVIAIAHGFTDQSHFTRQFRRLFGMTPGEYRDRVRLGDQRISSVAR